MGGAEILFAFGLLALFGYVLILVFRALKSGLNALHKFFFEDDIPVSTFLKRFIFHPISKIFQLLGGLLALLFKALFWPFAYLHKKDQESKRKRNQRKRQEEKDRRESETAIAKEKLKVQERAQEAERKRQQELQQQEREHQRALELSDQQLREEVARSETEAAHWKEMRMFEEARSKRSKAQRKKQKISGMKRLKELLDD